MKYFLQLCTLFLAFSQTLHCYETSMQSSLVKQIKDNVANISKETVFHTAVACFIVGFFIRSFFVKPPVVTPETHPYLFEENTSSDEETPQQLVQKEEQKPAVWYEKPFTPFTYDFTDSELEHWASINSNFEQPF